ncbi:MAG: UDP-N-acetylmuramoyl-L-alanine--D-glutamate ligase [Proteobacteria bacterium]|nr:UDP-N-acetylmuramoyl-L-alanine--D-glutamate ligase [Pseudomonadota bacterium]
MNLPDKILVVGLGATGIATAKFFARLGKKVTITDTKKEEDLIAALTDLKGVRFEGHFGGHRMDDFLSHPLIVISPGVDSELPELKEARQRDIKVSGEIELASMFVKEPIIAITGTNGKTTVTSLLGEIFTRAHEDVFVGGNIGNPLFNYVLEGRKAKYVILEVSSFQLETIETFHPNTSVLLNITEDHLDRYRNYEEYITAKYRIFENQTKVDHAVLNKNLETTNDIKANKLFFTTCEKLNEGAFFDNGNMYVRLGGREFVYKRALSPLIGIHNTENILSALLVSHIYGIEQQVVEEVLRNFKGLAHRVEPIRELNGVRFYNDSKATNVDATRRALESIEGKVILIAGGKDKGGSYKVIADLMDKVKSMILIGEAKERISDELGEFTKTYMEKDLNSAAERAFEIADTGDIVLFSPMCSSFDMFRDYKERGNIFKKIVESM